MVNLVLYDWVSITSKIHEPDQMIALLGLQSVPWEQIKGAHGYRDRFYWNCISIHYNGTSDMGVWLEMSGQGCRAFESHGHGDYEFLFSLVFDNPTQMKFTRLDVAFDDHSGILDMNTLISDTLSNNYVSKASSWEVTQSNKGTSVIVGSRQSPVLIRIYDKAAERNVTDGSHWIRVELQLRDERATEFARYQIEKSLTIGETFSGVLLNYLRFVEPDGDDNKWRWPLTDYWSDVIGEACRLSVYVKPGVSYNLLDCERFVYGQCGNAIRALLDVYDVDTFLEKLDVFRSRPNPKYARMVRNFLAGDILNESEE